MLAILSSFDKQSVSSYREIQRLEVKAKRLLCKETIERQRGRAGRAGSCILTTIFQMKIHASFGSAGNSKKGKKSQLLHLTVVGSANNSKKGRKFMKPGFATIKFMLKHILVAES